MSVNTKNWQELKKPNSLEIKDGGDRQRKATFVAEPLERGFGLTLGNALRRVLLSSLQGAAITSIKMENVLHEFSSLAGVREDVTDIVLNVKQIALRMQGEGPKRLQLSATGPAEVKAGDIAVSGDIEVMNKDLVICHLDEGATLNMELTADTGKGYVPAVSNRPIDAPNGLNPVDTLNSTVRQVASKVDNARNGQRFFVWEVRIESRFGDARMLCELIHGQRIVADGIHHFCRGTHDRAPSLHPLTGTESNVIFFTHG